MGYGDNYIQTTINTWFLRTREVILEINKRCNCSNCGGTFNNSICEFCGVQDLELTNLLQKLNIELLVLTQLLAKREISKIDCNELFNYLILLKDRNILVVNNLLGKYHYIEQYQNLYNQCITKMQQGQELDDIELHVIETRILNHEESNDLTYLYDYFITKALKKEKNISFEAFKELIKKFAEANMLPFVENPTCFIVKEEEDVLGSSLFKYMFLDEETIRALYEEGNPKIIFVISHELRHTELYKRISIDNLVSKFIIDEIMELVLMEYNKENYNNVFFEVEAEYLGIPAALEYLKKLKAKLPSKILEEYITKYQTLEVKINDENRTFNGDLTTVEAEFNKIVKDKPEILVKYKQLEMLYKVVDNNVVAKTSDELSSDLEIILANPNIRAESKEFYKNFYGYYIQRGRKN